jgi:hypothetical protein
MDILAKPAITSSLFTLTTIYISITAPLVTAPLVTAPLVTAPLVTARTHVGNPLSNENYR